MHYGGKAWQKESGCLVTLQPQQEAESRLSLLSWLSLVFRLGFPVWNGGVDMSDASFHLT